MNATDWELPGIDNADLDKAWTEEAVRRAKDLADDLYAFLGDPSGRSCWLPGAPRVKAEELCGLLWELGLHLESTADYDITGG